MKFMNNYSVNLAVIEAVRKLNNVYFQSNLNLHRIHSL